MSTIKIDEDLKNELGRLQQDTSMAHEKQLSYNEIVKNAIKNQALTPILMSYIYAKIDNWNPYDIMSWFYEQNRVPIDASLVEAYAQLVESVQRLRNEK
ncbi:hypothetical protein ACFL0D_09020 [Thermoproteota archaeon]